MPADIERMLGQADAAMIIGDRALDLAARMDNRIDLGEEWADLTDGLPFVYSLWVGREGALSADDVDILIRSREMGVANIDSIARNYASSGRSNGKPAEFFARYLTENIGFRLGKNELEGLKEYYSYCYYYGMIEEIPEFQFYPHLETRSKLTGSDGRSALMTGRL
jgi:predicted solute-binding protein